jgi:hypothetical protein
LELGKVPLTGGVVFYQFLEVVPYFAQACARLNEDLHRFVSEGVRSMQTVVVPSRFAHFILFGASCVQPFKETLADEIVANLEWRVLPPILVRVGRAEHDAVGESSAAQTR